MNGNGTTGILNRIAAGVATAAVLGLAAFAASHASDVDLKKVERKHNTDVSAIQAQVQENHKAISEAKNTLTRLDERSKNQSEKLDAILEKLP